jgi:small subunit ribosomal protein S4
MVKKREPRHKVSRRFGEGQFRCYYDQAARQLGDTGANLLRLLERRLDNVVYRLGFARTRPMARQLVDHGHVRANGRKVDIPSYLVRPGEAVELADGAARMPGVIEELVAGRPVPGWLAREGTSGRVLRLPDRDDMDLPIGEEQIVACYSR